MRNFTSLTGANPEGFGLLTAQTVELNALLATFEQLFNLCNDPGTKTPTRTQQKKDAKRAMVAEVRRQVAIVQAFPGTTDGMRRDLSITIRDTDPTPVPVPEGCPALSVVEVTGRTVRVVLRESPIEKGRARPTGVAGATVLTYVGEVPPTTAAGWVFHGNTTRTLTTVTFPGSVEPGSRVWLTAFWYNRRGQAGMPCTPVSTHVEFGGVSQAA